MYGEQRCFRQVLYTRVEYWLILKVKKAYICKTHLSPRQRKQLIIEMRLAKRREKVRRENTLKVYTGERLGVKQRKREFK